MEGLADEIMLDMTRRRLDNLDRCKSLRFLAAKTIINDLDYFFNEQDQREKIACLPLTLRKKLLHLIDENSLYPWCVIEGDVRDFDKRLNALKVLLPGIKDIKISRLFSYFHTAKEANEVLEIIAAKSPNVQSLNLNVDGYHSDEEFITALGKLKNLKKLQIWNCSIKSSDLKKLCRDNLRQLEYLDVAIDFETQNTWLEESSEDLQECFPKLQYFFYQPYLKYSFSTPSDDILMYNHLLEALPNLKLLRDVNTFCYKHEPNFALPSRASDEALRGLGVFVTNNLSSYGYELNRPEFQRRTERRKNALEGRPQVESLNFVCFPSENVFSRLLGHFGATLHTLYLHDYLDLERERKIYHGDLKFSSILGSCPSLESLSLRHVLIANESKPIESFAKLKRLEWLSSRENVCLSYILAAPELEYLSLDVKIAPEEINLVSQQITKGEILGKLTTLVIGYGTSGTDTRIYSDEVRAPVNIKEMCGLMKAAAAFLPNLIRLHVDWRDAFYNCRNTWEVVLKNYSGSHKKTAINCYIAVFLEFLGEKALCHILGEFDLRHYSVPSVKIN